MDLKTFGLQFIRELAPCCFRKRTQRKDYEEKDEFTRKADLFKNGKKRFYEELDFVNLLKGMRQAKMMFYVLFRQR